MKRVIYTEGPETITCGSAGTFTRGVARQVDDQQADRLLNKTSVKFTVAPEPRPAAKTKEA